MLHIGLIGLGGIGRLHLDRYRQVPDAQVVAVADTRSATLRADPSLGQLFEVAPEDVRWFPDYHDLVAAGGLDAVDICLPTYLHREAAVAALEAGLHVLCEKPMALSLEDADTMIVAAERADRILMIAHCVRFWPEYRYLADLYRTGSMGRLLALDLTRQSHQPNRGWMADARLSGGAIFDLHIHDVDFVQGMLGLPQRIYGQGLRETEGEGYSHVLAAFDYGSGLQVGLKARWVQPYLPFSARYEASFERAFVRFDSSQRPTLTIYRTDSPEPEQPTFVGPDAYVEELRYFAYCLQQREPPSHCPSRDSRNSVALVIAEIASIERGEMVECRAWATCQKRVQSTT